MNNKEFITELAKKTGDSPQETSELINALVSVMAEQLDENNSFGIHGFGTFEVKKKMERITVNPVSKLRMLVPPKLVLFFKPSNILKDKFR